MMRESTSNMTQNQQIDYKITQNLSIKLQSLILKNHSVHPCMMCCSTYCNIDGRVLYQSEKRCSVSIKFRHQLEQPLTLCWEFFALMLMSLLLFYALKQQLFFFFQQLDFFFVFPTKMQTKMRTKERDLQDIPKRNCQDSMMRGHRKRA